jgi:mRNA interferase MazF
VELPAGLNVRGVILADQGKSLDWRARRAERLGNVPPDVVAETAAKIQALIDPESR